MNSSDTSVNSQMGPGGINEGGTLGYNGMNMQYNNPAQYSPSTLNPSAGAYITNLNNLYSEFSNSAAGGAFNPSFYSGLEATQQNNLTSAMGNQYASMGLAGSSAEMGGINQAIQGNQMSWLNRQQGDQLKALSGLQGLNQAGYSDTMGIQNQYGDFEGAYNQSIASLTGMQQQQKEANSALAAGMLTGGKGGFGGIMGGTGGYGGGGGGGGGGAYGAAGDSAMGAGGSVDSGLSSGGMGAASDADMSSAALA